MDWKSDSRIGGRRPFIMLESGAAFWLVGYAALTLFVGTTIPTPLYRIYQEELHLTSGIVTLIFSVYVSTLLPTLLLFGRISDRIGRRPVLIAGFAVAASAMALFAMAHSLAALFAGRALQGIATGLATGTATAVLKELRPITSRNEAASLAAIANVGGCALGPLVAGLLAQYVVFPTTVPYLACLVLMIPTIALVGIPETIRERHPIALDWHFPKVPPDIRREFRLAAATSCTVWAATSLFLSLAPSYVEQLMEIDNLAVGGGITFLMLSASAVAQSALRRATLRRAIMFGLSLLPIGLAGFILAVPLRSGLCLLAGTLVIGAGQGFAFMGSLSLLNAIAPEQRRGEITASFYIVTYLGTASAPIGIGFAAEAIGLFNAVAGFALVIGSLAVLLIALAKVSLPKYELRAGLAGRGGMY